MGKLVFKTLRENVVDEIRMKILKGEFLPGSHIVEQNLSQEFGVSRGPIREALRQLEQEGLICYERNVGCSVCEMNPEDLYEIYLMRSNLEELAVETFRGEFREEDFEEMRELLHKMEELKEGELFEVIACDQNFHQIILERSGMQKIRKAWTALDYGSYLASLTGKGLNISLPERQAPIHRKLYEVCLTKDVKQIQRALREHYLKPIERLLKEEAIPE